MNSYLAFRMTMWYTVYISLLKGGLLAMRILIGVILTIIAGIFLFIGVRDSMALEAEPPLPGLIITLGLGFLYLAYQVFS